MFFDAGRCFPRRAGRRSRVYVSLLGKMQFYRPYIIRTSCYVQALVVVKRTGERSATRQTKLNKIQFIAHR